MDSTVPGPTGPTGPAGDTGPTGALGSVLQTDTFFNVLQFSQNGTRPIPYYDYTGGNVSYGFEALLDQDAWYLANVGPPPASPPDTLYGFNTAVGVRALRTGGQRTVAVGFEALLNGTTDGTMGDPDEGSVAVGYQAGFQNTGARNVFVGYAAQVDSVTSQPLFADESVVFGSFAFVEGSGNIAVGDSATVQGSTVGGTTNKPSGCIAIGSGASVTGNVVNTRAIGGNAGNGGFGVSNALYVGPNLAPVMFGPQLFYFNTGAVGPNPSSIRYKTDVQAWPGLDTEQYMQLRPVTFLYTVLNSEMAGHMGFGMIAEELEELVPEAVVTDEEGAPAHIRYDLLSVVNVDQIQRLWVAMREEDERLQALEAEVAALASQ